MTTSAVYVVRDRVKTLAELVLDTCEFYPGKYAAPANATFPWATYSFTQNLDFGQPYVETDTLQIKINFTDVAKLQRAANIIIRDLNRENPTENTDLYTAALERNIKLHDIEAVVQSVEPYDFIEGTDYFNLTIDILMQYVTLPSDPASVLAYIEGE